MESRTTAPRTRYPVAVLGATGTVGQAFVRLLTNHPWFELVAVAASERSAGKPYGEAAQWHGDSPMPRHVSGMTVLPCDPDRCDAAIVFSALDSSVATEVEGAFARAGRMVLSNAKNYRMEQDVPLVIAEVNARHLHVLEAQRRRRGWTGGIVTNGNCAAIVGAMALAPIHERFGIQSVFAATMQAVSGAGYPGVPSLDALGNVVPFIKDEEPKIEAELRKFLGTSEHDRIVDATFTVSAHANRVPVEHGHTVCMSVALRSPAPADEVTRALRDWKGDPSVRELPSAPAEPLAVADAPDRPQPRRDVNVGAGMTVTVGRVRPDPVFDVKLVAMGHNVIRGAAGASILNAELLVHCGMLPERTAP